MRHVATFLVLMFFGFLAGVGGEALAQRAITFPKAAHLNTLTPEYDASNNITGMRIQAVSRLSSGGLADAGTEMGAELLCVPADITSAQRTACVTCLNALADCWNTKAGL